ncbi:MAG: YidC/Oxa1 family insertase periplasmic-domain containing protein [Gemmataceae bacterium]
MQQKNLLLFFIISLGILLGWSWLQSKLWPPQPKPEPPAPDPALVWQEPRLRQQGQAVGQWTAVGLDPLGIAVTQMALAEQTPSPQPEEWRFPSHLSASQRRTLIPRLIADAVPTAWDSGLLNLAAQLPVALHQRELIARTAIREIQRVTLGSYDEHSPFNLQVVLTSRGAGVERLILNKFEAANRMGLPEDRHMTLIPPTAEPSNLLYHYVNPGDNRPLDTLAKLPWTLVSQSTDPGAAEHSAVFQAEIPGQDIVITKTYTLATGTYHLGLAVRLENRAPEGSPPIKTRYQLAGAHGLPIEGVWYTTIFRNALVGWQESGSEWRSLEDARQIGLWEGGNRVERGDNKVIRYAAVAIQFFASAVVVDVDQRDGQPDNFIERVRATLESPPDLNFPQNNDITVRLTTEELTLAPNQVIEHRYLLYNGPVKVRLLNYLEGNKAVAPELVAHYEDKLGLYTLTDYPSPGVMGRFSSSIGLTWLIVKFTNLMHWLIHVLHNYLLLWYGLCIIMLTILVRGALFPLSRRQALQGREMQEKMAKIAPEMKKLKEKYRNDFQALTQAQQELYRRHGINPFATLGGCLLLFVQMPVFLGLYFALQESIFLRLASFLWIENLAAPDMLFWWSENIPLLSTPDQMGSMLYLGPYFNLLPVLAVTFMILQQKIMMPPPTDEQQEMQQKMMKYMMVFFGILFYKIAAGLCVYFIASSIWGLAERKLLPKSKTAEGESSTPTTDSRPAARPGVAKEEPPNGLRQRLRAWWDRVLEEAGKQPQARKQLPKDTLAKKKPRRDDGKSRR